VAPEIQFLDNVLHKFARIAAAASADRRLRKSEVFAFEQFTSTQELVPPTCIRSTALAEAVESFKSARGGAGRGGAGRGDQRRRITT
jgi:hypothetical protein